MARPASGRELLAKAKEMLTKAKSVEELRQAQALILPLEYGFSITQVAAVIGTSRGWACQLRMRFIRNAEKPELLAPKRGGRRREHMSIEEEKAFLAPFLDKAASGILVVGDVHNALEQHLGHKVALASAYNLLHRHNWRKLAPDKRNVKADIPVQEDWKKTPRPPCANRRRVGQARPTPADVPGRGPFWPYFAKQALLVSQA